MSDYLCMRGITKTYQAYGDELMNVGIVIDRLNLTIRGGDYSSLIYVLKEVK